MTTVSDLGRQLKLVHPEYKNVPDAELGRRLKAKHPGFYDHATEELESPPQKTDQNGSQLSKMDGNTVPETPKTLQIQIDQLQQGLRRVVFIARGAKTRIAPPDGMRKLTLPSGEYIYDPAHIKPQEILAAIQDHSLNEILGTADSGYGTPAKQDLQEPTTAVVARDADGETSHSALTDEAHAPEAAAAAEELKPEDGSVTFEPPHIELEHRQTVAPKKKIKAGQRWPKPGATS